MADLPKKIVNFRFFPILFLCMIIGSLVASLTFFEPYFPYYVMGVGLILALVLFVVKRRKAILPIICILGLLCTYVLAFGQIDEGIRAEDYFEAEIVEARVEYVEDSIVVVSIVDGVDGVDGLCEFDTNGVYDYPLNIGNVLTLGSVKIEKLSPLETDGVLNTYFFNSRTRYTMTAVELISFDEGGANIVEAIRNGLMNATKNLPDDVRGVTIALLTGDKYALNDEIYDNYKVSGTAHVLAVSGMHVGFLVLFLEFILKRLRLKRIYRIVVLVPILFFLCALCDFTPSVVRSAIMVSVHLLIPVLTKRKYDTLSSMSLAGVVILIANPMSVYNYGFLLSYSSVLGITLFGRTFDRWFKFLPKTIGSIVSVSMAATVGVLPLNIYLFGEFSLLSILTNVLVLPVLIFGYGVLVLFAFISVVFPPFAFLMEGASWLTYYMNFVTGVIASVDFMSVNMKAPLWFCLAYYLFVVVLSDFINLKRETKRIILIAFIILLCAYFCFFCNFSPKIN